MKADMVSGTGSSTGAGSWPDRRAFLRVGAGCAVPLLAGGVLASRALAQAAAPDPVGQDAVDPVLAHLERELARTYHAMRGRAGIRGEHVRSLAANLELAGVCLDSRPAAAGAAAGIRRRIANRGRDATVQEGLAAYDRLAEALSLQHGITPGQPPDAVRLAGVLDRVAVSGLRFKIRGHKSHLNRLAAAIDRAEPIRGAKASPLQIRQKPGDDFMGYPEERSAFDGMSPCELIGWLQDYLQVLAVLLALVGMEAAAAVFAIITVLLDRLSRAPCNSATEA
jgi:hypothetical protein